MTFWTVFSEHAGQESDLEAILAPGRSPLSFGKLPLRMDTVRAALNSFGVGRGELVALALPDGPETAMCLLGVASCAIAVPLNPGYTDHEFCRYLTRIRPKAIIVPAGAGGAPRRQAVSCGIPIIDLRVDPDQPAGMFELHSGHRGRPETPGWNTSEDFAVVLMTSGSTDRPKLVPHRQRHLAAYAQAFAQMYDVTRADRCMHTMPMFHGHGMATVLVPLLLGSGVVCPERFDVASFFAHLRSFHPTWYSAAYTIHHRILDGIEPYRNVAREAQLRFIRSGSGRLEPKIMLGLEDAFGAPVLERYGSSEAPVLTYNPLPPAVRKPGTVGVPILNEVRVRDECGNFLGPNQEGEVIARGPLVFDGYWDDPEATNAAFVDGWFRTGDLGRFDNDGYLTITGRVKDVINRGGEKVSPAEVDAALRSHPDVRDAATFPLRHPTLGEEVAAAVVQAPAPALTDQVLTRYLLGRLTGFKVPRRFCFVEEIPKSPAGKLQRYKLAEALGISENAGTHGVGASDREVTPLEAQLQAIWARALQIPQVSLDDNFFMLGGDSLQAVELFLLIEQELGRHLPRSVLFEAGTVSEMAQRLEECTPSLASSQSSPKATGRHSFASTATTDRFCTIVTWRGSLGRRSLSTASSAAGWTARRYRSRASTTWPHITLGK